jgi:hypothetical protein
VSGAYIRTPDFVLMTSGSYVASTCFFFCHILFTWEDTIWSFLVITSATTVFCYSSFLVFSGEDTHTALGSSL